MNPQPPLPTVSSASRAQRAAVGGRGWRWWLAPRPVTTISSVLSLLISAILLAGADGTTWSWRTLGALGAIGALLTVDRFDCWVFGERPPISAAMALLALRLILIGVVARMVGMLYAVFLLCMLPYLAALYFGARGVYLMGALAWIVGAGALVLERPIGARGSEAFSQSVTGLALLSIALLNVATMALLAIAEQRSRVRAEQLLADLETSHAHLQTSAVEALAATEERHRLAHVIHHGLERVLANVNERLEQALVLRAGAPSAADQAVRDAKQSASAALQDVRRSVGTLRAPRAVVMPVADWSDALEQASRPQPRRRWWFWLRPRTFDLAPTAAFLGILAMYLGESSSEQLFWSWHSAAATLAIVGLILVDRCEYWRFGDVTPQRASVALLAVRLLLCGVFVAVAGGWWLLWLLPLMQYVGFMYYGAKIGLGLLALSFGIFLVGMVAAMLTPGSDITPIGLASGLVAMAINVLLVLVPTQSMRHERASRERAEVLIADLACAHRQLEAYAIQTLTATEERNHLAREIHDGLGHYLTVINVQLEKALAFRPIDAPVADQAVRDAMRLAREALQEIWESMGSLDSSVEAFSLLSAVRQLAAHLGNGLAVDVRVDGHETGFSPQALLVLYRVVQEGLTNVQKHARASRVSVTLTFGDHEATLDVHDNGCGFAPHQHDTALLQARAGYGLQGVRERLALLGGRLELESLPGSGTHLHIAVPKDARGRTPWAREQQAEGAA
jgi:signal transduction histidine kinase